MGKAGPAWTRQSAFPAEIDKTAAEAQKVFELLRILGGRVVGEYEAWQGTAIPRGGEYAEVSGDAEDGV